MPSLPTNSEAEIITAAVAVIRADNRVTTKYSNIVLLEMGQRPTQTRKGDLWLTAIPVRQEDLPSESSNIGVDLAIEPVLRGESLLKDSLLESFTEFNEFRKLLSWKLPLVDGDPTLSTVPPDQSKVKTDDRLVQFYIAGIDTSISDFRIPKFIARWADKINPATGERVG